MRKLFVPSLQQIYFFFFQQPLRPSQQHFRQEYFQAYIIKSKDILPNLVGATGFEPETPTPPAERPK